MKGKFKEAFVLLTVVCLLVPTVFVPAINSLALSSSLFFGDGFESGNLTQWSGTYTTRGESASVISSSPLEGNYQAKFTTNDRSRTERAYVYHDVSELTSLYVRGYIQITSGLPLRDRYDRITFIGIHGLQNAQIVSVNVQRKNGLDSWTIRSQDGTISASSGPIENKWYCIELYVNIDGVNGAYKLWVDGELLIDESGLETNNNGNVSAVRFGLVYAYHLSSPVQLYGDAFAIASSYIGVSPENTTTEPVNDGPSTDPTPEPPVAPAPSNTTDPVPSEEPTLPVNPPKPVENPKPLSFSSFLGFSGYVTSLSELDSTLSLMKAKGFNTYRISFRPSWLAADNSYHGYNEAYINRILSTTDFLVIVDATHLYPPQESSALDARNHWTDVRNRIFQVLDTYGNNPRVAVELINEYISSDYNTRMQGLITEIRNAGYTNMIVVNKWNTAWFKFTDPLDNTYQGYHYYFNSWSPDGAISQMNTAKSLGIKVINTEIGASYNEYSDYTQSTVDETETFINRCTAMGAGNLLWQNNNDDNWATYVKYNIDLTTT